jgi:hypothetical protein
LNLIFIIIFVNEVVPAKAVSPITFIVLGISIEVKISLPLKASLEISRISGSSFQSSKVINVLISQPNSLTSFKVNRVTFGAGIHSIAFHWLDVKP